MYPNFWSMQAPDLMSVHDSKWSRYEWRTATNDTKERPLIRSRLVERGYRPCGVLVRQVCGVEVWRGGLGGANLLPTLSSVGASLAPPCFRFHTPLVEPDVRIYRIRLSEKTHAIAIAIACDAVCNF
jgi:hypothetical protein